MKHILWSAVTAALLFASCAKDDAEVVNLPASDDFTATLAAESRTVLDGTSVLWEADDLLTIFTKTSHNRQYKVKSLDSDQRTATFGYVSYTSPESVETISSNYALYPYDAKATIAGDVIYTTLAANQVYDAEKVDLANSVMVAKSSDNALSFKNAGALVRFKLSKEDLPDVYTLQSIKLASTTQNIAGPIAINTGAESTAIVQDNGVKEVALTEINTEITTTQQLFYIALPAMSFEDGEVTVTFVYTEGEKSITLPAFALAQNTIKTFTYTIKAEDFEGTTPELGEALLTETNPEALAQEFANALAQPDVTSIVFPELPEGSEVPLSETLSFGASESRAVTLAGRDLTIDGNGATLNFTGSGRIIDVTKETEGMSLTLKNLTIVASQWTERGINYNTNGKLTLENVTIKSAENSAILYAVNLPGMSDNATVEIKNSNICGHIALNLWGENTTVTVTDSTLSNFDNTAVEDYPTIVLNNDGTMSAIGSVVTITGGKVIAKDQNGDPCTAVSNPALGTVTIDSSAEVIGYVRNNVAIVDYGTDNYYGCLTLQNAIDKASETAGCTVILLTPIELTEAVTVPATANFTLDLNGQTISQSSAEPVSMLVNKGSLTIKDGKGEGKIALTFTGTPTDAGAANTISNRGVLVVNSGVISNTGNGNQIGYAIDNYNGATLTVNGGEITASGSSYYDGVRLFCGSTETVVTVNRGNISTIWAQNPSTNKATEVKGTVVINGGTIGTTYYENYTTVKVKSGVTATVTPYGAGSDKTTTTEENGYTVYSFVQAYTISSIADLTQFASEIANGNNFAGETVKLTQNITLTEEFSPIAPGTRSGRNAVGTGFAGIFDGGGNTIDGLTITNGAASDAIGFFGIIDGGEVKNVNFTNVNINVPNCENAGTVAGLVVNGGKVSGVTVSGSVAAKRGNGGIVGRMIANGEISNCVNNATMTATAANVGGIVGAAYYTSEGVEMTISNCTNNGAINSTHYGVGGIVGLSSANVIGCTNTAEVTGAGSSIGGVVGEQQNAGSVINCTNTKGVTNNGATGTYGTGGIIGWIRYTGATNDYPRKEIVEVSGCKNEGSVKGTADAGGIVGVLYNLGNIHDNKNYAEKLTASAFAAGIVANAQFSEATPGLTSTEKVQVVNNLSTTSLENMTGNCKDLYVYDNSQGVNLTANGNTQQ